MAESIDPSVSFLAIERKVNSEEMLEYAADKPHNEFLWAPELNKIVKAINVLRSLIRLTPAEVQVIISNADEISLGNIGNNNFLDVINTSAESYSIGEDGATVITFTANDVDYVYFFVGEPGVYGIEPNLQLTGNDVVKLSDSSEPPYIRPATFSAMLMLSQVGGAAPTAEVLFDELTPNGFGYTLTRSDSGSYTVTVTSTWNNLAWAHVVFKYAPLIGKQWTHIIDGFQNYNQLNIKTSFIWSPDEAADGILTRWPVEIVFYLHPEDQP